jgi:hypothetical protein
MCSNHGYQIAGDGWLQNANCSSGTADADVRRLEDGRLHVAVANIARGSHPVVVLRFKWLSN